MAYSDYNRAKSLSPTSFNDASSTIVKAQPIGLIGNDYTGFDGFESGSSQLGWEGASGFSIDSNAEMYLTNSLQISSNSTSREEILSSNITSDGKKFVLSFKQDLQSGESTDSTAFILRNSNGDDVLDLRFQDNGDVTVNGISNVISTWSTNTIYDVEIVLDFTNNQADIIIDGVTQDSGRSFETNSSEVARAYILADHTAAGSTVNAFFDRLTYTSNAEDTVNAGGMIGIDDTNVAGPSDIGVYDGNDNLLPYEIENDGDVTSSGLSDVVWIWTFPSVAGNWTRDDSVQAQVVYGDGPTSSEEDVTGTWESETEILESYNYSQSSGNLLGRTSNSYDQSFNGTQGVTGQFGQAASGDGVDDLADTEGVNGFGNFTSGNKQVISFWTKPTQAALDEAANNGAYSVDLFEFNENNPGFGMTLDSDGTLQLYSTNLSNNLDSTTQSLTADTWYHVVAIFDQINNDAAIYIDGSLDAEDTSPGMTDFSTSNNRFVTFNIADAGRPYDGDIDEVKVYDVSNSSDISQDWIRAEYDASPKAGQVFFTQDAATTTTTGQTISTPETQLTQTTEDPAVNAGATTIQATSPTLLTSTNPTPAVNATNTVSVQETTLTSTNPDPTVTVGQTILAPETQLTAANPDPAVTGGATTLNVNTTQLTQTTEPVALNRRLVVGVATQLNATNPEPNVSPGTATASIPETQLAQTAEPLTLQAGETKIQAARPTELTVTTPPLTVTPVATSIQVDTTELTQITVKPALALAIILTGNTEALIQTPNKYALMDQHTFKKDDLGDPVTATLTDKNNPGGIDLTGAKSVNLLMHDMNDNNVLDKEVTVTDAENGEVEYQWESGDPIETSGVYKAEFEIIDVTDDPETVPNNDYVSIKVQDDLN